MEILNLAKEILDYLEKSRLSSEEKSAALEAATAILTAQAEKL
jgi:hypothetical protein